MIKAIRLESKAEAVFPEGVGFAITVYKEHTKLGAIRSIAYRDLKEAKNVEAVLDAHWNLLKQLFMEEWGKNA